MRNMNIGWPITYEAIREVDNDGGRGVKMGIGGIKLMTQNMGES